MAKTRIIKCGGNGSNVNEINLWLDEMSMASEANGGVSTTLFYGSSYQEILNALKRHGSKRIASEETMIAYAGRGVPADLEAQSKNGLGINKMTNFKDEFGRGNQGSLRGVVTKLSNTSSYFLGVSVAEGRAKFLAHQGANAQLWKGDHLSLRELAGKMKSKLGLGNASEAE